MNACGGPVCDRRPPAPAAAPLPSPAALRRRPPTSRIPGSCQPRFSYPLIGSPHCSNSAFSQECQIPNSNTDQVPNSAELQSFSCLQPCVRHHAFSSRCWCAQPTPPSVLTAPILMFFPITVCPNQFLPTQRPHSKEELFTIQMPPMFGKASVDCRTPCRPVLLWTDHARFA